MTSNNKTDPMPHRATRAVWAGEDNAGTWKRSTQVPVAHSVSYGYRDVDHWYDVAVGKAPGHIYSRNTNPTVAVFEEKLRQLEGGEAVCCWLPQLVPQSGRPRRARRVVPHQATR
jgi:cystathionine gamma-synthase